MIHLFFCSLYLISLFTSTTISYRVITCARGWECSRKHSGQNHCLPITSIDCSRKSWTHIHIYNVHGGKDSGGKRKHRKWDKKRQRWEKEHCGKMTSKQRLEGHKEKPLAVVSGKYSKERKQVQRT